MTAVETRLPAGETIAEELLNVGLSFAPLGIGKLAQPVADSVFELACAALLKRHSNPKAAAVAVAAAVTAGPPRLFRKGDEVRCVHGGAAGGAVVETGGVYVVDLDQAPGATSIWLATQGRWAADRFVPLE